MMGPGLAAVFGPQSAPSAKHVQAMAETFHVPHIETRWDYSFEQRPFSINIHPHPAMLSKVRDYSYFEAGCPSVAFSLCRPTPT